MKRYAVWSQDPEKLDADGKPIAVCELIRTDRSTAYHDASIVREIIGRKSWVQETEGA